MLVVNYRNWQSSFSELPRPCQQCELTFLPTIAFSATEIPTTLKADVPVAFRGTKILPTVGVNIPVDRSFNSYQNPNNFKNWNSWTFQSYLTPGRHYISRQLSELKM